MLGCSLRTACIEITFWSWSDRKHDDEHGIALGSDATKSPAKKAPRKGRLFRFGGQFLQKVDPVILLEHADRLVDASADLLAHFRVENAAWDLVQGHVVEADPRNLLHFSRH